MYSRTGTHSAYMWGHVAAGQRELRRERRCRSCWTPSQTRLQAAAAAARYVNRLDLPSQASGWIKGAKSAAAEPGRPILTRVGAVYCETVFRLRVEQRPHASVQAGERHRRQRQTGAFSPKARVANVGGACKAAQMPGDARMRSAAR